MSRETFSKDLNFVRAICSRYTSWPYYRTRPIRYENNITHIHQVVYLTYNNVSIYIYRSTSYSHCVLFYAWKIVLYKVVFRNPVVKCKSRYISGEILKTLKVL